ncbi:MULTISPECIES: accessory gene regulator B family protein [Blautia]|uniref:accessory gene regulator B family protein n=1 Tax=Blautia TaxID=572511 RepID=UPI000BA301CA|nr:MULTISPECIES: accessory gene regulator B family protein [Blautia]
MKLLEKIILDEDMTTSEKEIALYGVHALVEIGVSILVCLALTSMMKMYLEGLMFFVIFIPLRSFAGGVHCDKWWSCLIMSSFSFWAVLFITNMEIMSNMCSYVISMCCIGVIIAVAPVINEARPVAEEEFMQFAKRLFVHLGSIIVIETILFYFGMRHYLQLIAVVLLFMVMVLLLGKRKWKKLNIHNTYREKIFKTVEKSGN